MIVKRQYNSKDEYESWIRANTNQKGRFVASIDGKAKTLEESIECHATIKRTSDIKSFIGVTGSHYLTEEWMNYLSSCKIYSQLFKHEGWEFLYDGDKIIGFIIPDVVFREVKPYPIVYSFLIDTRMAIEFTNDLVIWDKLVTLGVDLDLSRIVARYLNKDLLADSFYPSGWHGNHLIINDTGRTDWKMFLRGEYNTHLSTTSTTSLLWQDPYKSISHIQQLRLRIKWSNYGKAETTVGRYATKTSYKIPEENLLSLCKHIQEVIDD